MALIARETELADLDGRLRRHRLVTIVGPGGIGKTSLARAAATAALPRFARGVGTVDLTRIDESADVGEFVAGQLGYPDLRSLLDAPDGRPWLVVVDNCEHVIEDAARTIDALVAASLSTTVLCTSRSPLDLPDESIMSLGPLDIPPPDLDDPTSASMRMLTERVVDLGGVVADTDLGAAAEICRRLDGVPLALELAAAQARTVPLTRLLDQLDARPAELARRRFRGRSAHRSIVEAVDWSLRLLDDATRRAFEQLGVVDGPFDAEFASAVVDVDRPTDVVLDELVAASLLTPDTSPSDTRYRMLRPVRAVALDGLDRSTGARHRIASRIADHVVARATAVLLSSEADWAEQLPRLLDGYDGMIAAQRWMLDHDDGPDRSLVLLAVMWGVVQQSHRAEVAEVGEQVLARWPDPTVSFWADAAATVSTCYHLLGRHDDAIALATAALEHAEGSGFAPVTLRRALAQTTRRQGRLGDARRWFAEGAEAADVSMVPGLAMVLRVDEAIVASELGESDRAWKTLEDVADAADRAGAAVNGAWARCGLATVAWHRNDPSAAGLAGAAVDESSSIGYAAGESYALRLLAAALLDAGDLAGAAKAVLDLRAVLLERRAVLDSRAVLDHAARILELRGEPEWADLAATAAGLDATSTLTARVALDVVERGRRIGQDRGIGVAVERCRALLSTLVEREPTETTPTSTTDPATPMLRREGDVWRWTFADLSVVIKASKGVNDLAQLLARPGREISAMDLVGSAKVADDGIEALDDRSRREIEERIRELRADIDEADAHHDIARSERASAEMDLLVDELTAALGLGGRARRSGSDAERARSAVTQRIRSTIRRLDDLHPKLGAHLAVSVETGTFCAYRPAEPTTWVVDR